MAVAVQWWSKTSSATLWLETSLINHVSSNSLSVLLDWWRLFCKRSRRLGFRASHASTMSRRMIPPTVSIVWRQTNRTRHRKQFRVCVHFWRFHALEVSIRFPEHKESNCHKEAVLKTVTLPATTRDISESLTSQLAAKRLHRCQLLSNFCFFVETSTSPPQRWGWNVF